MRASSQAFLFIILGGVFVGVGCTQTSQVAPPAPSAEVQKKEVMTKEESAEKNEGAMMKKEIEPTKAGAMMEKKESVVEKKDAMTKTGTYEDYLPAKLALAATGKVVLFFKAGWCPTCKAVDSDILASLNSIPNNFFILKVDYDSSTDLKRQYGVTYQHTFVRVDKDGQMLKKWAGSPTLAEIIRQAE